MKRWALAVAIALALHGLLAVALAFYFAHAPEPEVLAELDLSSVELSLAEKEDASAPVVPVDSSPSVRQPRPKEIPLPEKPRVEKAETALPPDPSAPRFPEPGEDVRLETRDVTREDARRETKDVTGEDARRETRDVTGEDERRETRDLKGETAPAPSQARVDAPPRPRRTIRPQYPKGARLRGEQGNVGLEILVNAEGTVDEVKIVTSSGFAELDEAAVKAAKAAKFRPAESGGRMVASTARLTLTFRLKER